MNLKDQYFHAKTGDKIEKSAGITQPASTCLKLAMETPEQYRKSAQS